MIFTSRRHSAAAMLVRARMQHAEAQRIYDEAHRAAEKARETIRENHLTEQIREFIEKGRST